MLWLPSVTTSFAVEPDFSRYLLHPGRQGSVLRVHLGEGLSVLRWRWRSLWSCPATVWGHPLGLGLALGFSQQPCPSPGGGRVLNTGPGSFCTSVLGERFFFLPICAPEGVGSGYRLSCPSPSSKRLLFPGGEGRWEPRLCSCLASARGVFSGFLSAPHLSSEHPACPSRTIDHSCVYSSPGFHMLTAACTWP